MGAKIVQGERNTKRKSQNFRFYCRTAAYLGEAKIVQGERRAKRKIIIFIFALLIVANVYR